MIKHILYTATNNHSKPSKILIAEDERDLCILYKRVLENRNHEVITTEDGEECLKTYNEELQHLRFGTISMSSPSSSGNISPFDVVILDHDIPKIKGMEVAKEILAVNPHQRIIFASAYVKETLVDSIKKLKQVVEVMQKPFHLYTLIDTIEDNKIYSELQGLNIDIDIIRAVNPTHEQILDLLERLKKK